MRFRKLRIAWSLFWGMACVVLIGLWVRSYRGDSSVSLHGHWLVSFYGRIWVDKWVPNPMGEGWADFGQGFIIPYWLPFSLFLTSAVIAFPWISVTSFSLRSLLIATTLVAVVLGLVVWTVR